MTIFWYKNKNGIFSFLFPFIFFHSYYQFYGFCSFVYTIRYYCLMLSRNCIVWQNGEQAKGWSSVALSIYSIVFVRNGYIIKLRGGQTIFLIAKKLILFSHAFIHMFHNTANFPNSKSISIKRFKFIEKRCPVSFSSLFNSNVLSWLPCSHPLPLQTHTPTPSCTHTYSYIHVKTWIPLLAISIPFSTHKKHQIKCYDFIFCPVFLLHGYFLCAFDFGNFLTYVLLFVHRSF